LEVKKLEVNMQLCKNDYYSDFIGEQTGAWGSLNNGAFLRYMTSQIGGFIADANETMVWKGTDTADSYAGYEVLAAADGTVIDVTTPIVIDATNVASELRRGTKLANDTVLGMSDCYIYLGNQIFQALMESNNDKANANPCGENCFTFDGIKVFNAHGMTDDAYIIAAQSNLHYGEWQSSDLSRVTLIDQEPLDGSDNMNFVMKYFAGAQIGIGAEVTYYAGGAV